MYNYIHMKDCLNSDFKNGYLCKVTSWYYHHYHCLSVWYWKQFIVSWEITFSCIGSFSFQWWILTDSRQKTMNSTAMFGNFLKFISPFRFKGEINLLRFSSYKDLRVSQFWILLAKLTNYKLLYKVLLDFGREPS